MILQRKKYLCWSITLTINCMMQLMTARRHYITVVFSKRISDKQIQWKPCDNTAMLITAVPYPMNAINYIVVKIPSL